MAASSSSVERTEQISNEYYENHQQQLSEISREDILRQVFGDVGDLIDDFSCAVETTVLLHGRMYVTSRFLCFYSNLFGLEKKIRIPYSHITLITKENTVLVIPNAIAITTYRKEYLFRSFWDRDECYRILKDFIESYKVSGAHGKKSSITNSNSAVTAHTTNNALQKQHVVTGVSTNNMTDVSALPRKRASSEPSADNSIRTSDPAMNESSNRLLSQSNNSSLANSAVLSTLLNDDSSSDGAEGDDDSESDYDDHADLEWHPETMTPAQLLDALHEEIARSKLSNVVITRILPITVSEFADLFVEDHAVHSWLAYHERVNDTSLECTIWKQMPANIGVGRELKFFKPVNLPGLKSTRGVKVQRYRRFGDVGLVICSSTRLEDVPAADTFSVDDMLSVEAADDGVRVQITFEVKFLKTTMFRYLIDKSTTSEMTKWLEVFFVHMDRCVDVFIAGGRVRTKAAPMLSGILSTPDASSSGSRMASPVSKGSESKLRGRSMDLFTNVRAGGHVFWAAWVALLLALFFCAWQWKGVNVRLDRLNSRLNDIAQAQDNLTKAIEKLSASRSR